MNARPPFQMPYGIGSPPLGQVLRWKLGGLFAPGRRKSLEGDVRLSVQMLGHEALEMEEDFIVWLGHATFLIQMGGVRILTDPVFGGVPMVKRLIPFPVDPSALRPDIILISHGHYDHLDLTSLSQLAIELGQVPIFLPSGLARYLPSRANTTELAWYDTFEERGVTIRALPAAHWHRRTAFDLNRALWCSFAIEKEGQTIFFAGDTALEGHFEEIRERIGSIDLALMPIGAYLPRIIMRGSHMDPSEALEATRRLGAKRMIPYHYGTFKLSDEPVGEPQAWIERLASEEHQIDIEVLGVGIVRT